MQVKRAKGMSNHIGREKASGCGLNFRRKLGPLHKRDWCKLPSLRQYFVAIFRTVTWRFASINSKDATYNESRLKIFLF
ncbi:unnamed protein product [Callosobruchus maculatus]|uniref:Uncharacterized protein n=1 Tax=Callosobruchus maculatus TaxID=64391 RepID=A0A653DPW5_CALMS|nr:unnamed protein product [Callosobruchus maculatus]